MTGNIPVSELYIRRRRKIMLTIAIMAILSVVFALIAIAINKYNISFFEAYDLMIAHIQGATYDRSSDYQSWFKDFVVWELNVPRAIAGACIGAILAIGGSIMQSTTQNPLADPYTTGIASGALFGVSLYLVYGYVLPVGLNGELGMIASAFTFSMVPAALIIVVTTIKKNSISPSAMILAGIGAMYMFSAGSSLMRFSAEPNVAQSVFEWTVGSVGRVGWAGIPYILISLLILVVFSLLYHNTIDTSTEGDNVSKSLGTNPKRIRAASLVIVSLCTAIVVCFVGTLAFVGLVCPHIARAFVGTRSKNLIPISAGIGALMLLLCDTVARMLIITGLPTGVVTAFVGAPILIWILVKQRKQRV